MSKISLNHMAVVSRDKSKTVAFFRLLGRHVSHVETVPSENVETTFIPLENSSAMVEIIEETNDSESHPVGKYRKKFGSGIHHMALNVSEIEKLATHLKSEGIMLVNEEPKVGAHETKIIFIHPKSTGGILVELVEKIG